MRNTLGVPQPLYEKVMLYKTSASALAELEQRVADIQQVGAPAAMWHISSTSRRPAHLIKQKAGISPKARSRLRVWRVNWTNILWRSCHIGL
jgi:hypothetical protein